MRAALFILFMLFSAACSPAAPASTPTAVIPTPNSGTVEILTPQAGAIIYADMLYLAGTAAGVTDGFTIQVVGADEQVIAQATVPAGSANWQVELPHGYSGDPTEAIITALPAAGDGEYDRVTVALAGEQRPEGSFGSITAPAEGDTLGGDVIEVSGRGSGLFENSLLISLIAADGAVLDNQIITLNNPYFIDDVPWRVELSTRNYSGSAAIHIFYQSMSGNDDVTLDSTEIHLTQEAG